MSTISEEEKENLRKFCEERKEKISRKLYSEFEKVLNNYLNASGENEVKSEVFGGECSQDEISRMLKLAQEYGADVIVGIGGGKALDTAKAAAHYGKLPVAIIPTLASTDAPCSALSVIYTPAGEFESGSRNKK